MGIIAGLLVQNTLKYLLNFGQVTQYLGYSSLQDFFPTMEIKPNPGCTNSLCVKRQEEWASKAEERAAAAAVAAAEAAAECQDEEPLHEENEWGIEVVNEEEDEAEHQVPPPSTTTTSSSSHHDGSNLPSGLKFELPAGGGVTAHELAQDAVEATDANVDDLMAQLAGLTQK